MGTSAGACGVSDSEHGGAPDSYGSAGMNGDAAGEPAQDVGGSVALPVGGRVAAAGRGGSPGAASGGAGGSGAAAAGNSAANGAGGKVAGAGSGGSMAAAGSGGTAAAGSGGSGDQGDVCPTDYVMATHIVINVSWKGTLALSAGSGKVHVWTKSHFVENGNTSTVTSQSCGSVLPAITTTSLAGSEKILPEIPDTAWDAPSMPTFTGTATRTGDVVNTNPGIALLGLSMSDPTAAWPAAANISGVDHDGDGKSGVTANSKETDGFKAVPVDIGRSKRADKVYLAIRNVMTLNATAPGCPDSYVGTANVSKFENHVIGCHVEGGNECDSTQAKFVDDNRTVYVLGSATFSSQRIDAAASCADVRAALP